jgi:hypothetical protein
LTNTTIVYSSYFNSAALAIHLGNPEKAEQLWQQLAILGKKTGHSLLFRLALSHINNTRLQSRDISLLSQSEKLRPGDIFNQTDLPLDNKVVTRNSFWLDGEKLQLLQLQSGTTIITDKDNKVIDAWQTYSSDARLGKLQLGDSIDRSYKIYGMPSRHMYMSSGEYLAYDHLGVALHLLNNKVVGWFLYQPTGS